MADVLQELKLGTTGQPKGLREGSVPAKPAPPRVPGCQQVLRLMTGLWGLLGSALADYPEASCPAPKAPGVAEERGLREKASSSDFRTGGKNLTGKPRPCDVIHTEVA